MRRFVTISVSSEYPSVFDEECSCALACGYVPCGSPFTTRNDDYIFNQCFYDQNGEVTYICTHCSKCEECQISPEEDYCCSEFKDERYPDNEDGDEE